MPFPFLGKYIVVVSQGGIVNIQNADTNARVLQSYRGTLGDATSVTGSLNKCLLVIDFEDGTIRLWSYRWGSAIGEPLKGHSGDILTFLIQSKRTILSTGIRGQKYYYLE